MTNRNIIVIDENNIKQKSTYLRRANGLVKNGRARWVDDKTICLLCPPLNQTEDILMTNKNIKDKMIKFLLEHANPSIKRRVKSEILHNLTPQEAAAYQEQILGEPIVQAIIALQKENGWISVGKGLNGVSFDQSNATKYLAEKAVDKDTPVLKRAMNAFLPLNDPYIDEKGRTFEEFKYPCAEFNLPRCACIARAGYDDVINISAYIQAAFNSFKRVLEVDSVFDIMQPIKKGGEVKYIFKDYENWPCRHYLDILAHTQSWKNDENIKIVAKSVNEMMRTDNPELVSYCPGGYSAKIGCHGGIFPAQGLTVMGSGIYPSPIMCRTGGNGKYHFELIEWFARCGVVSFIPALKEIVGEIAESVDDDGICRLPNVAEDVFKNWNKFAGLQLEVDWKSKIRRDCDITFRALLILHYSEQTK